MEVTERFFEQLVGQVELVVAQAEELDLRMIEPLHHRPATIQRCKLRWRHKIAVHHAGNHRIELTRRCSCLLHSRQRSCDAFL